MTVAPAPAASSLPSPPNSHLRSTPFFIFGCPRSGTSLLRKMLGTHPNLAVPGESHLYDNIYPIVERYGDLSHSPTRTRLVTQILRTDHIRKWTPAPSASETLGAITRHDFHGIVEGLLRAWTSARGKARWGEKTPQHTLCWRRILTGFPGVQVIHLVRDGRDVMLSYRSAVFGPKHVYPLAVRWQRYLAAAEEAHAFLGEKAFLQVRYEDLVAAPETELRRICDFLGEEYTPLMLAYHQDHKACRSEQRKTDNLSLPIMSHNTGKWRTQMTDRDLRIFEALAGSSLERYGYERALVGPRISRWEALACRYLEHPPRKVSAVLKSRQARRLVLQRLRLHLCLML